MSWVKDSVQTSMREDLQECSSSRTWRWGGSTSFQFSEGDVTVLDEVESLTLGNASKALYHVDQIGMLIVGELT